MVFAGLGVAAGALASSLTRFRSNLEHVGGVVVIVGVVLAIFWSFWIGLIIAIIGLAAFGGFVRGKWY